MQGSLKSYRDMRRESRARSATNTRFYERFTSRQRLARSLPLMMDWNNSAQRVRSVVRVRECIGACVDVSGETLRLRSVGPFTLKENLYPNGLVLSKHSHERAYITFVIEGAFRERYAARSILCRAGMIRFLPAGQVHENEIQARSRCLHV